MKSVLRRLAWKLGYAPISSPPRPRADIATEDRGILDQVRSYSMTSEERLLGVIDAVRYVERVGVPGDFVECGVWRGGSAMAAALALKSLNASRTLCLYDTFEGMSAPTAVDRSFDGVPAEQQLSSADKKAPIWCYATLEEVQQNLARTGYAADRIRYIRGTVEETIPATMPEAIAILRLDTDWYESTAHELRHLFPRLTRGGIIIIDDYGHWQGARKAVDEYFAEFENPPFLHRLDYTGRIGVKP